VWPARRIPADFGGFYMHNIFIALMQRSGAFWSRSLFRLLSSVFSVTPWCNPWQGKPRRYASSLIPHPSSFSRRRGFTLVELLVSTVLALVVMFGVVSAFALIGQGVSDSRATLEMSAQLREAAAMLKNYLGSVTAVMSPPRSPDTGEGYFEYTEGPIGAVVRPDVVAQNNDTGGFDTTVGDIDDILMFTVRSRTEPFVGRTLVKRFPRAGETKLGTDAIGDYVVDRTVESSEAEVICFVRGRTLYQRRLLIVPQHDADLRTPQREMQLDPANNYMPVIPAGNGFYANYDISVRVDTATALLTPNSLADLTKPENRYAHRPPHHIAPGSDASCFASGFPFHPHFCVDLVPSPHLLLSSPWWGPRSGGAYDGGPLGMGLGLPTLGESACVTTNMLPPFTVAVDPLNPNFDAWLNPYPWQQWDGVSGTGTIDPATGTIGAFMGPRIAEDVILNNVIGFDVKAWDPGAPVLASPSGQILLPGDPGHLEGLRSVFVRNDGVYSVVSRGAYVDLNYGCLLGPAGCLALMNSGSVFAGPGDTRSRTIGTSPATTPGILRSAVYDTWSTHYESDSNYGNGRATNGFDDNADGVIDDVGQVVFPRLPPHQDEIPLFGDSDYSGEVACPPPYAAPLRGIQVKIRVFEPDSRQIREVTIVQEFVTK